MVEVRVRAVGIDVGPGRPVVLIEETGGTGRIVPVSVGEPEAVALAAAFEGAEEASRPDTHRLLADVLAAFGRRLVRVRVHALRDRVFHAELVLDDGTTVDARTSDALVLALRAGAGLEADESVLEGAGVAAHTVTVEGSTAADDGELERFRRFLDTAAPEDFGRDPEG